MTREAEAEAWVRKPKRMIHNQSLIQVLTVLILVLPLPCTGLLFWLLFAYSAIAVQSVVALWAVTMMVYGGMTVYVRIKQRNS
jgi:hypothetical protein